MDMDALLTISEAAASLGVQPGAIRTAVSRELMQAERVGGTVRKAGMLFVRRSEIERYRRERLGKRGKRSRQKEDIAVR